MSRNIPNFQPDAKVELSHDGFLRQNVLCLNGLWINRSEVIKYIANSVSGVHSGMPSNQKEKNMALIRNAMRFGLVDGDRKGTIPAIKFDHELVTNNVYDFIYRHGEIDAVLFELMCSAYFLVRSPKMIELERVIVLELGIG